jgi:hypothetical protein
MLLEEVWKVCIFLSKESGRCMYFSQRNLEGLYMSKFSIDDVNMLLNGGFYDESVWIWETLSLP